MYSLVGMSINDRKIIFLVLMSLPEGLGSVGGSVHQEPRVLAKSAPRRSSWVLVGSQLIRTREVPHKDSWAVGLGGGISLLVGFPAPSG